MKWRLASVLLVAFVTMCSPAFGDYEAGVAAFKRDDYKTALKEFRPLAEKGHPDAQYKRGYMYNSGKGVPRALAKAAERYRKAADQGFAPTQNCPRIPKQYSVFPLPEPEQRTNTVTQTTSAPFSWMSSLKPGLYQTTL